MYCLEENSQIITPCQLNNINKLLKIKINYSKIPPSRCVAPYNPMGLLAMQYREDG